LPPDPAGKEKQPYKKLEWSPAMTFFSADNQTCNEDK